MGEDCTSDYQWGDNADYSGPLGIDYCGLYVASGVLSPLLILVLFFWVAFLMAMLANTASNYFSPTLSDICEKLHMPYDIAGVTFLALGNGAPDFFSLLASFSGGADPLVGVGALLGGSMFVCTVVVGSIALLSPCPVVAAVFLRDIGFHLLSVCLVAAVFLQGGASVWAAAGLLLLYLAYVSLVVRSSQPKAAAAPPSIPLQAGPVSVQTAFWHPQPLPPRTARSNPSPSTNPNPSSNPSTSTSSAAVSSASRRMGGYTFAILDDEDAEAGEGQGQGLGQKGQKGQGEEEGEEVINLSVGYTLPLEQVLREDYWSAEGVEGPAEGLAEGLGPETASPLRARASEDAEEALEQSLLEGDDADEEAPEARAGGLEAIRRLRKRNRRAYESALSALYWQQWALTRGGRRNRRRAPEAGEEGDGQAEAEPEQRWWARAFGLLEAPVTLARDLTIPTLCPLQYRKLHVLLHPVLCPALVWFLAFPPFTVGDLLLCVLLASPASFALFLLTQTSRPPAAGPLVPLLLLAAFCMCVCWVFLLASELITLLSALGQLLAVPPAFLGLTVLAWGNSVGDFFTNTAVARAGLGGMALAGCYAGPVFNLLVGFGSSLLVASLQSYPAPFAVQLDASSGVSLLFLGLALCSTVAAVVLRGYRLERSLGIYLLSLYALYTVVQALLILVD